MTWENSSDYSGITDQIWIKIGSTGILIPVDPILSHIWFKNQHAPQCLNLWSMWLVSHLMVVIHYQLQLSHHMVVIHYQLQLSHHMVVIHYQLQLSHHMVVIHYQLQLSHHMVVIHYQLQLSHHMVVIHHQLQLYQRWTQNVPANQQSTLQ